MATTLIEKLELPDGLIGIEKGTITVTFIKSTFAEVKKVKLSFKDRDENLLFWCGEHPDSTFSVEFGLQDSCVRKFDVAARSSEKDSQDVLTLFCYDNKGKLIDEQVRSIELHLPRQAPEKVRDAQWVWAEAKKLIKPRSLLYILSAIPVIAAILWAFLHYGLVPASVRQWVELFEIGHLGADPHQYEGHLTLASWSPDYWEGQRDSESGYTLKSPEILWLKLPDYQALYDFTVSFETTVAERQRSVAWIARAADKLQDYYLFQLTFPPEGTCASDKCGAILEGFVYRGGKRTAKLGETDRMLYAPFVNGDTLRVQFIVKGKQFHAHFLVRRINGVDDGFDGECVTPSELTDTNNTLRWGTFGFDANQQNGNMKVRNVLIDAPPRPSQTENDFKNCFSF